MSITCATILLEQDVVDDENAIFTDTHILSLVMGRELWDDLGSPVELTVAIRPGDQLNNVEAKVLRA